MAAKPGPCRKCGVVFVGKYCKPCDNRRSAARRKADPKAAAALVTAWKKRNRERTSELNKLSYERNKDSIALRAKKFRAANRERLDAYNRAYEQEHPDIRTRIQRKYYQKSRDELNDHYIKGVLRMPGINVPRELIELKRITMQIKRQLKEAK